ncbi:MAG: hypothetical protein QOC77_209 [Thermoleophilaceae bacterium]|jgi:hypothetical protein|nr:hypothetical protein [Thermoleophilaceae bacterium]
MRNFKLFAALAAMFMLTLSSSALAAAPTATTGPATAVTSTTATVNGSVNAGKEQTTYHFEYGKTTAYGTVTPNANVGKGNKTSNVSADLATLATSTTYHYRVVATNGSGTVAGADMTFTTLAEGQAPPGGNAITIAASPASIPFGRASALTGQLVGPNNANVRLTLQSRPSSVAGAQFADAATGSTDAAGNYSFAVAPLVNTDYQVVAKTRPQVTSPVQRVKVRFAVTLRLSDATPRRGTGVRFSGSVKPAHDGASALIQRRAKTGKFVTVVKVLLKPSTTAGQSVYSKRLRIKTSGVYRVRVLGDGQHATGTTKTHRIRVH